MTYYLYGSKVTARNCTIYGERLPRAHAAAKRALRRVDCVVNIVCDCHINIKRAR